LKILPAFGQRLMKRRFAGWHPLYVALVVGEDWSAFAQVNRQWVLAQPVA